MEWLRTTTDLTEIIARLALTVLAIVWLYEGAHHLALGNRTRRPLLRLVFGCLIVAGFATFSFVAASFSLKRSETVFLPEPKPLASEWGLSMSSEEREKASRSYASVAYTRSGKLLPYFDTAVGWRQYSPTEDDIANRDRNVEARTRLDERVLNESSTGFHYIAVGLMATALGWLIGRETKRKASS